MKSKRKSHPVYKWISRDAKVPKGWRIAKTRPSHHDRYSVLIEKIGK